MAGYYHCLPAVSHSLYLSLLRSESFKAHMFNDQEVLLGVATKLRHKELFHDCLSLISGRWHPNDQNFTIGIKDQRLAKYAVELHNLLGGKLAYTHQAILRDTFAPYSDDAWQELLANAAEDSQGCLIRYFRTIYDDAIEIQQNVLIDLLAPIIENNLHLLPRAIAGEVKDVWKNNDPFYLTSDILKICSIELQQDQYSALKTS
ncbi:predicted protein [Sclerotinia sclerotiorum 1980 UF-70]|uniref:BTB domain-containing protein n=1 Tax=Sclerotinia sclerotiorum (strain ATCC 18683 / 1980 / Ss-1) TaxID=665079 RepID=A7F2E2_SCLS1|nr:predicted protein [Sclerotinia sclerotiorum 1980 UF-70]EDN95884.1 predicted protein [Sclerotinia sclerotiorum 1980 UF-70]